MSSAQVIQDFLKSLLTEAGMDDLTPDVRAQMMQDLEARLQDRFFGALLTQLTDEELTQFRELQEKGEPQEKLEQFISDHLANPTEFLAGVMEQFRNDYLGNQA
jgi:hypothetical protein